MLGESGAGNLANVEVDVFDGAADEHGGARAERPFLHVLEALHESGAVAQGLLGRVVGFLRIGVGELEEGVVGGDDVLDGGAVAGLAQGNGVDQHVLVGDEPGGLLEAGQSALLAPTHLRSTGTVSRISAGGSGGRAL